MKLFFRMEKTEEDYYRLPETVRAELINGQFYYMAAPSRIHQKSCRFSLWYYAHTLLKIPVQIFCPNCYAKSAQASLHRSTPPCMTCPVNLNAIPFVAGISSLRIPVLSQIPYHERL